ncbi:translocator protein homolog [Gastrolobium bilobum]|uniref:translocator protein homolog n=1 Tax=Gastrolobium bilobum TaxID=150636 RepID=UPI002AB14920|nr:translocator protein homolog [Gastrolobium bilobum]
MASNDLKQRVTLDPHTTASTTTTNDKRKSGVSKRDKRMVMAKRGLRSLAIAVSLPLSLTVLSVYLGSSMNNQSRVHDAVTWRKPFWFPPSWALHLTCLASSFLMGLSAWMVWADGGFHRNPTALLVYLAQLLFTLLWDPIVFGAGATRFGLMVCLGWFGAQLGCMRVFGRVNSIAGDLIKPCLAWSAFLFIVNLKLLFV